MRALKGLLIYVGIVLAIIVGLFILLFAGMYFFPSFRLMGIGVVHGSHNYSESILLTDYTGFNAIELSVNSKKINIDIVPVEKSKDKKADNEAFTITGNLDLSVFGISYDITEYGIVKKAEVKDNILKITFNVTEPDGLLSYSNASMRVSVPKLEKIDLSLNTEKGDISIDGGMKNAINIGKLNLITSSGDFSISNCYHDTTNKVLDLDTLSIKTINGKFNFYNIENISVKNTIKLNGNNGEFAFKNLNASMNAIGSGIKLIAEHIITGTEGFEFFCDKGYFKINKLETGLGAENSIVTENCDIEITEVIGNTGIFSTFGNIDINTLHGVSLIKSKHGNVKVTHANNNLTIDTEYGNITVGSYKKNGIFSSIRGDINVKSTSEYEDKIYTKITNEDGAIKVDNNINKLLLETTGKSKASIVFRQIKGDLNVDKVFEHKVTIGNKSSAIVYLPTINYNTPFKFKATGNISGEISGLKPEYEGNTVRSSEEYQFFPRASEENKEACQRSCYFEFYGTIHFEGYQNV